jgi:hypothetical protein
MTPQEIIDNELFINSVEKIYMNWSKEDLILEIFNFMSVEDYKKVLRDFSQIDEITADFKQFEKERDERLMVHGNT